jgi:RimJ/RimL family protein N-acetyltransferase
MQEFVVCDAVIRSLLLLREVTSTGSPPQITNHEPQTMIHYGPATTTDDLNRIIALQAANLRPNLAPDVQREQGFLMLTHDLPTLQIMNRALPHIIAKDGDQLVGYALSYARELGDFVHGMGTLIDMAEGLTHQGKPVGQYSHYYIGQVCVAASHRGQGVFDGLYATHRQHFADHFDLLITDLALRNTRSRRAHIRVGFELVHQYENHDEQVGLIIWDWSGPDH